MKKLATLTCVILLVCFTFIASASPAHAAQTYAVVYEQSGNFYIGTKNQKGYFFHNNSSSGGNVIPKGQQLNGSGKKALPGGKLEPAGSDPAIGAANEFYEETGVELRNFSGKLEPREFHQGQGNAEYYGVYYLLSSQDFSRIKDDAEKNLKTGVKVAEEIRKGNIKNYNEIHKKYPGCPQDNELASGESWNLNNDWSKIQALKGDRDTDWFYYILDNLRKNL
ncbi:MAG: NUDIX hydrolase [Moorea sp. SIO3I7]|uniref:NUDIX hydrolase n=1 Tax=unclassified Moorena TaxID=2683338 RepID=UPI0013C28703|nr:MULTISPECIES: NUDIX hydrolase [unclassified Moorena]NEN97322.1 NUDIX hydrolase [Moorena sp. SIO3I7]NEO04227.1 NUDIX hydrolase [Moorena sp. SIO3I8]NEP20862.1 NUDIX hydrolase [Moorena sp. SIO3I6]